jgi:hypothetical protein
VVEAVGENACTVRGAQPPRAAYDTQYVLPRGAGVEQPTKDPTVQMDAAPENKLAPDTPPATPPDAPKDPPAADPEGGSDASSTAEKADDTGGKPAGEEFPGAVSAPETRTIGMAAGVGGTVDTTESDKAAATDEFEMKQTPDPQAETGPG